MAGGVFVLKDDNTLVEMQSAQFVAEDDFQRLLSEFPALLSGDQIDGASPRRWVLVKREKSVPAEEGGSGRWSIDHLFLDQDGIPTLVEVKRQSDTRLRREVVGQMLDYAANGVAYWPVEEIRAQFEALCAVRKADPIQTIEALIGLERSVDEFWQQVKTNLQAGRVRMLFVADVIPPELKRVVEFLNAQMDPAEVLALELRQYQGQGLRTLVPRVFGQTEEAQARKGVGNAGSRQTWDEATFFAELGQTHSAEIPQAREIYQWAQRKADSVMFGSGINGSANAIFERSDVRLNLFSLMTSGRIVINFGYFQKHPFDDIELRREFLNRLNQVPNLRLDAGPALISYPSIPLTTFANPEAWRHFFAALDWFVEQLPLK